MRHSLNMFPELKDSLRLCDDLSAYGKSHILCEVSHRSESYAIPAVEIGSMDPNAPVLGIVAIL